MSEEEKKAIKACDLIFITLEDMMSEDSANDYRKSYLTLKNLIEKQQKEIEELKEKLKDCDEHYSRVVKFKNHECIMKDKIREKIEELENEKEKYFEKQAIQHEIEVLHSLLEEE